MKEKPNAKIETHFGRIEDPRTGNATQHKLIDIIAIAILATICGADGWTEIEMFGKSKQKWLGAFLELSNGIPSHDTFGRVFSQINPEELRNSFLEWVETIEEITRGQVIAIDGKELRGSKSPSKSKAAINMVSAWATKNELVMGQVKVDEKSNEITAIPRLLEILDISGCIVTIDAIGTQTNIAEMIIDQGGDYLLAVKKNQGQLFDDMEWLFSVDQHEGFNNEGYTHIRKEDNGHGRQEIRECWTISNIEYLTYLRGYQNWKGLKSLAMIVSERTVGNKTETKTRYYISSLEMDAKAFLKAKRSHWGIENRLHWVLDIAFQEDMSRVRKDHAPENFAILRHMALNMLKQDKSIKAGIHAKRLRAGWDEAYLLKILTG